MARIYMAQARHVRHDPQHSWWHARLLRSAAQRRKEAQEPALLGDAHGQGDYLKADCDAQLQAK
jgi:hypothetical protein